MRLAPGFPAAVRGILAASFPKSILPRRRVEKEKGRQRCFPDQYSGPAGEYLRTLRTGYQARTAAGNRSTQRNTDVLLLKDLSKLKRPWMARALASPSIG
jgi:hypothetical protein